MLSQLRSIFDVIVRYKAAQQSLYESGTVECAHTVHPPTPTWATIARLCVLLCLSLSLSLVMVTAVETETATFRQLCAAMLTNARAPYTAPYCDVTTYTGTEELERRDRDESKAYVWCSTWAAPHGVAVRF